MIHVVAFITAKPGQRQAVLEKFRANMAAVHADDGCISYEPVIDLQDGVSFQAPIGPDSFVVIERWASAAALRAHAAAPHMKEYGAATAPLIADRVIHVLAAVGDDG
jgi:quinol monooxygenase YgiN